MNDLTPRTRAIIYIAALAILLGLAIASVITKTEALEYIAYLAGALGLGTAVQYRPTLTASERDRAAAVEQAAIAAVNLARAEAPADQLAAAIDYLGAQVKA